MLGLDVTYIAPELVRALQDQQRRISQALLEKAKEMCLRSKVAVETITVVGEPKDVICAAVEKLNIDLLIMGSHGRGAVQRLHAYTITFLLLLIELCVNTELS